MGFGFNLFFIFILLPLTAILILIWAISGKFIFGKALLSIWTGIIGLISLIMIINFFGPKPYLEKDDFYGQYIIDRTHCPGKQADWQYESFKFKINSDNSIAFYAMDKGSITEVFKGNFSTVKPNSSEIPVMDMEQPTHHILTTNPTLYRRNGGFYLVFNSPKFGNVFFKKGGWEPLTK